MKTALFVVSILLFACTSQDQTIQPIPNTLRESRAIWEDLKSKHGGVYAYSVRYSSVFGFWSEYKYSIRGDSIKTILVIEGEYDSSGTTSFVLDFDTLSHQEKGWHKTIDEQYQFCQDSVLTLDKSRYTVYDLQFLSNGILKRCTYYPRGCQDDCTMGPRIDTVFFE